MSASAGSVAPLPAAAIAGACAPALPALAGAAAPAVGPAGWLGTPLEAAGVDEVPVAGALAGGRVALTAPAAPVRLDDPAIAVLTGATGAVGVETVGAVTTGAEELGFEPHALITVKTAIASVG